MTAILTALLAFFAREPQCQGRMVSLVDIAGTLMEIEQPYCLHRPVRHRIAPNFAQMQMWMAQR